MVIWIDELSYANLLIRSVIQMLSSSQVRRMHTLRIYWVLAVQTHSWRLYKRSFNYQRYVIKFSTVTLSEYFTDKFPQRPSFSCYKSQQLIVNYFFRSSTLKYCFMQIQILGFCYFTFASFLTEVLVTPNERIYHQTYCCYRAVTFTS